MTISIPNIKRAALIYPETGKGLAFQFNPESITDNKASEVSKVSVIGRSHPRLHWMSGSSRVISFELYLNSLACFGESGGNSFNVREHLKILRAMQYPERIDGANINKVSPVMFICGQEYSLLCVVISDEITHKRFSPDGNSIEATIQIELEEIAPRSIMADFVRSRGYGQSNVDEETQKSIGTWGSYEVGGGIGW